MIGCQNDENFLKIKKDIIEKKRPIIPVKMSGNIKFVEYSDNIFSSKDPSANSGENYYIFDDSRMGKKVFDLFFSPLKEYNEEQERNLYYKKIESWLKRYKSNKEKYGEEYANKFLSEFNSNPELLLEALKKIRPMDHPLWDEIPMHMGDGSVFDDYKYISEDQQFSGILAAYVVRDDYKKFAEELGCSSIKKLKSKYIKDIEEYSITQEDLDEFFSINFEMPNHIYLELLKSSCTPPELSKLNFFKICKKASFNHECFFRLNDFLKSKGFKWDILVENLNSNSIVVTDISFICSNISFKFMNKTHPFERQDDVDYVLDGVISSRRAIESHEEIRKWFSNIYYCENLDNYCLCNCNNSGEQQQKFLLPVNDKTGIDVVNRLKSFLKDRYDISLSLDRKMHSYTRDGFKKITHLEYTEQDVESLLKRTPLSALDKVEDKKDFLVRPQSVNNNIFGGYAKTCPLCKSKVLTELTGWRLYPLKQIDDTLYKFEIICCPNCHDAFTYASDYYVDIEKWKSDSILSIRVDLNGSTWTPREFKAKLAHRALIELLNKQAPEPQKWASVNPNRNINDSHEEKRKQEGEYQKWAALNPNKNVRDFLEEKRWAASNPSKNIHDFHEEKRKQEEEKRKQEEEKRKQEEEEKEYQKWAALNPNKNIRDFHEEKRKREEEIRKREEERRKKVEEERKREEEYQKWAALNPNKKIRYFYEEKRKQEEEKRKQEEEEKEYQKWAALNPNKNIRDFHEEKRKQEEEYQKWVALNPNKNIRDFRVEKMIQEEEKEYQKWAALNPNKNIHDFREEIREEKIRKLKEETRNFLKKKDEK